MSGSGTRTTEGNGHRPRLLATQAGDSETCDRLGLVQSMRRARCAANRVTPYKEAPRVCVGLRVAGTGWGHYVTRMLRASRLVGLVKPWGCA